MVYLYPWLDCFDMLLMKTLVCYHFSLCDSRLSQQQLISPVCLDQFRSYFQMATLENNSTLTPHAHLNPDDSLISDEYEVIESHVAVSENHALEQPTADNNANATVNHWSIQQSITLDGNMSINLNSLPQLELNSPPEKTLQEETPVLDGSVTIPANLLPEREESLTSWGSNETLNSMLASHAETKELLQASITKIENIQGELGQIEELKQMVTQLKEEVAEKERRIQMLEEATIGGSRELTEKTSLAEDLYQKGLQIDQRDSSLNSVREELEAARRMMADLQNGASSATKYLNDQLDEMCAKYLHERELRTVAEEQLNALQQGRPAMMDEGAAANELRLKNELLEEKEQKIRSQDEEIQNRDEIIKVLREDHLEGNRIITEKEQKITELERIMKSNERLMMESC